MFSRRLLRIKVLQVLYAHYKSMGRTYEQSERELTRSIQKSYDLYFYLLLLIMEVADYATTRKDLGLHKKVPSHDDLNPNTRFIDNRIIHQLRNNQELAEHVRKYRLSWNDYPEIVKTLFGIIKDIEFYKEFMNSGKNSYSGDKELILAIYENVVLNFEDLYLNLEEQNIFWIDDVDFVLKMVIKTIKKFDPDVVGGGQMMPKFKDADDQSYVIALLRKTIINQEYYLSLIQQSVKHWELERIAFVDSLIMQLAISEVVEFFSIPVKVSINEYIELAKLYSTRKSSQFINGILDDIIDRLKKDGKIVKSGRGLIGEI